MPDWLVSIPAFIVAIGVLVAVHEYGHFWVARRVGVKVLRYSLGFGPKVWGRVSPRTGIEYWVSAVPLGGYVKMLDEREAEVAEADKPYAFNRQHPLKKLAVVFAGPGVNFLFAIFAYWLIFMLGVPGLKPIIGNVPSQTPAAQAQLHEGDRIVAVDGDRIDTWQQLQLTLLDQALDGGSVQLTVVDDGGMRRTTTMALPAMPEQPTALLGITGLAPYTPPTTPVIARIVADGPAADSALQTGDKVVSINGQAMTSPTMLVQWVQQHPDQQAHLVVKRDGQTLPVTLQLGHMQRDGKTIGRIGVAIGVDSSAWAAMRTVEQRGPLTAIPAAVDKTWDVTVLTLRLMGQMVVGNVSWRNISGPIQIAHYAGETASIGLTAFLGFMALVSVSLAIINLMPIPVLDGGHILYYSVEWIRGKPLSEAVQMAGQQVGMVALVLLMGLAFYNDILRLLG